MITESARKEQTRKMRPPQIPKLNQLMWNVKHRASEIKTNCQIEWKITVSSKDFQVHRIEFKLQ